MPTARYQSLVTLSGFFLRIRYFPAVNHFGWAKMLFSLLVIGHRVDITQAQRQSAQLVFSDFGRVAGERG